MERRFSLGTANSIANLTLGEIDACFEGIHHSERSEREFCGFLENIHQCVKSDTIELQSELIETAVMLKAILCENIQPDEGHDRRSGQNRYHGHQRSGMRLPSFFAPDSEKQEKEALRELASLIEKFPTKALLLPRIITSEQEVMDDPDFLISDSTLAGILDPDTELPFLVLQPNVNPRSVAMRNAFPYLEEAIRNTDLWPAVLFWNNDDYVFVPVEDEGHLDALFQVVRTVADPLPTLKIVASGDVEGVPESTDDAAAEGVADTAAEGVAGTVPERVAGTVPERVAGTVAESIAGTVAESIAGTVAEGVANKDGDACHYLFHLSDLHFGMFFGKVHNKRLQELITEQVGNFAKENATFTFVITGDSIDTPKRRHEKSFQDFYDFLAEISGRDPLRVLGNHDIFSYGLAPLKSRLAFLRNKQPFKKLVESYPHLSELESGRIVELDGGVVAGFENKRPLLLLFNSNTGGTLAQGKIGQAQLNDMDRQLKERGNLDKYLLIAVMHHHLLPFPDLDEDIRDFYVNVFPGFSLASLAITESTMILEDTTRFFNWLLERNVRILLHGHKHLPFHTKIGSLTVVACGSSTGVWQKLINYNLIKLSNNPVSFSLYFEDERKKGKKSVIAVPIETGR